VLAAALPSVGVFFMLFTCLFALPASALELARVGTLLHRLLIARPLTAQQLSDVEACETPDITNLYAQHLLILLLALASALAHPLAIVFAVAYFGCQSLVYRHQFAHVYRARSPDHVHASWPVVNAWALCALLIAQIGYCGLFVLKRGVWQAAGATPLPFLTLLGSCACGGRAKSWPPNHGEYVDRHSNFTVKTNQRVWSSICSILPWCDEQFRRHCSQLFCFSCLFCFPVYRHPYHPSAPSPHSVGARRRAVGRAGQLCAH
jgi:hypothetical protein